MRVIIAYDVQVGIERGRELGWRDYTVMATSSPTSLQERKLQGITVDEIVLVDGEHEGVYADEVWELVAERKAKHLAARRYVEFVEEDLGMDLFEWQKAIIEAAGR